MKARLLVVGVLLLLPSVSAASVDGTLTVRSAQAEAALFSGHPQGAYLGNLSGVASWTLTASRIEVQRWDRAGNDVGPVDLSAVQRPTPSTYTLDDVHGSLADDAPWPHGWLGVYDTPGTRLSPLDPQNVSWLPQLGTTLNPGAANPEAPPRPEANYYDPPITAPTLSYESHGRIRIEGDFVVKFEGLNVTLQARQNESVLTTGVRHDPGLLNPFRETWAYLTLTNATLVLDTSLPLLVASDAVDVASCEALAFDASGGRLEVDHQGVASRGAGRLEGRLLGRLVAVDQGGQAAGTLTIQGTTRPAGVPYSPGVPLPSGLSGLLLLVVVGSVVVAGAAAWRLKHRASADQLTVEQCMDLSERAIEEGSWGLALDWNTRALALLPGNPRLLADRGTILESSGRVDEALDAYRRAADRGADGEGEILLARLLLRFEPDSVEAATAIVAALRKSPEMVFEVEEEETYHALRDHPAMQQALRAAHDATRRK